MKGGYYIMNFQVGSTLLEACVLANVRNEDVYGYNLTQNLKEVISISESTLYPVLRRLQSDSFLTVYDQPYQGRNRRYYSITERGKEKLREYVLEWSGFKSRVDTILLQGGQNDE